MENVFFEPRVGVNYESTGFSGIKLLVLGESHYCKQGCTDCGDFIHTECRNFTKDILAEYLDYKNGIGEFDHWMKTYTRFCNILCEKKLDVDELTEFWDSVIFYNYVQSAAEEMRVSPSNEQFKKSTDAFIQVLEKYNPDLILVWGERLWNKITEFGRKSDEDILDNGNGPFYYFTAGDKEVPAYGIYHPSSSSFTYEHSKYMKEAIRLVTLTK